VIVLSGVLTVVALVLLVVAAVREELWYVYLAIGAALAGAAMVAGWVYSHRGELTPAEEPEPRSEDEGVLVSVRPSSGELASGERAAFGSGARHLRCRRAAPARCRSPDGHRMPWRTDLRRPGRSIVRCTSRTRTGRLLRRCRSASRGTTAERRTTDLGRGARPGPRPSRSTRDSVDEGVPATSRSAHELTTTSWDDELDEQDDPAGKSTT
jgi:hypothetical protein